MRLRKMTELYSQLGSWERGAITGQQAIDVVNELWSVGEREGYHSERGQLAADAAHVAAAVDHTLHENVLALQTALGSTQCCTTRRQTWAPWRRVRTESLRAWCVHASSFAH